MRWTRKPSPPVGPSGTNLLRDGARRGRAPVPATGRDGRPLGRVAITAAALVLALLAAGCGGNPGASGVAHIGSTTTTIDRSASRDPMAQAIKFAGCMRKHGVPDFPDPRTSGTGSVLLSVPDSPKAKAAQTLCRRLLPG